MLTKEFVLAGDAIFTVENGKGEHYTFKVEKKAAEKNYPDTWFVRTMTGTDNVEHYSYLGILDAEYGGVRLTRASKFAEDDVRTRVVRWALSKIWAQGTIPEGYAIRHNGFCGRCGRVLTNPESLDTGIGPECAKIMARESLPQVPPANPS